MTSEYTDTDKYEQKNRVQQNMVTYEYVSPLVSLVHSYDLNMTALPYLIPICSQMTKDGHFLVGLFCLYYIIYVHIRPKTNMFAIGLNKKQHSCVKQLSKP